MQKQIEQKPHSLTKKCTAKKIFFKKNKLFSFIRPTLLQNEFRAGMDMGKKRWLLKKTEKKSCFGPLMQFVHTVGIQWVAAGLVTPPPAAAAATATAAATFIDWIDLAAPPVTWWVRRQTKKRLVLCKFPISQTREKRIPSLRSSKWRLISSTGTSLSFRFL